MKLKYTAVMEKGSLIIETMGKQKDRIFTKLIDKQHSPLVIRKYTHWGFPIYVGLITDNDLTDLDDKVLEFMKANVEKDWVNNIQALRNLAGNFSDFLNDYYEKTEGVAIVIYADKAFISSLFGDFMNHASCRVEFYGLLNMSTGV